MKHNLKILLEGVAAIHSSSQGSSFTSELEKKFKQLNPDRAENQVSTTDMALAILQGVGTTVSPLSLLPLLTKLVGVKKQFNRSLKNNDLKLPDSAAGLIATIVAIMPKDKSYDFVEVIASKLDTIDLKNLSRADIQDNLLEVIAEKFPVVDEAINALSLINQIK